MMPVSYEVVITRRDSRLKLRPSEFNRSMRWAMTSAGLLWIEKYLPMHFESGAAGRYSYSPRPLPYDRMKERITKAPALPLRFIADVAGHDRDPETLMGFVLGNRASGAIRVLASSRGDEYGLRVPIRMPHPLNPKYSSSGLGPNRGELVRKIKGETQDMARQIVKTMREEFRQNIEVTVERIFATG